MKTDDKQRSHGGKRAVCSIEHVKSGGTEYLFTSCWVVAGTVNEVRDLVFDPLALPQWWPSAFLEMELIQPGDRHAVGTHVHLISKGWMPYTINMEAKVVEGCMDPPYIRIEVFGDLTGSAMIRSKEHAGETTIDFNWRVDLRKRSIRWLAFLIWPVLVTNHQWVMKRGHESLELEIKRRRCRTKAERAAIPDASGPVFPHHNWHRR